MNYRNKKLLDYAKHVPKCTFCGKANDGSIVAAHSNQLRDGKGKGIKAHDYRIAYLCFDCHRLTDESRLTKKEKALIWEEAHRASIPYFFEVLK